MAGIINLPNSSGKSPFELCDDQYFYRTNSEISTLGTLGVLADPLGYMQIGYTQLYLFQRLVLWNPAQDIYQTYPETEANHWLENKYCVIGDVNLVRLADGYSFTFPDPATAEAFMRNLPASDPNSVFVVARLLWEYYWH